ncbi:hypothetical protein QKW35_06060 [Pontibacterium granulatum]|uniref:hypothetical protein n=1 Tax=Pontibacterium granulatum TaxID=2036029 RepID=UPI00249A09FD|nr:hypothetical protein [Pontibacterium granulatum]MDI3323933.1 hypothetical protein [Pontibacterium granulatum]
MEKLVRKIEYSKWKPNFDRGLPEFSADAITNCLKTSKNTLSVWCSASESEDDIKEAVLANVGVLQSLATVYFVILDGDYIRDTIGLDIQEIEGNSFIKDKDKTHKDIIDVNYKKIGEFAGYINSLVAGDSVDENPNVVRLTKGQVKKIILEAHKAGRVDTDRLTPSLLKALQI